MLTQFQLVFDTHIKSMGAVSKRDFWRFNLCFSETSYVGKAMLGIAFLLLDFVRSFCGESGAAWICPKNGTRTAELVQKRQQRSCWPAGEYASALDESFPLFLAATRAFIPNTKHHSTLCKVCTSQKCSAEEDLLSVQLVQ